MAKNIAKLSDEELIQLIRTKDSELYSYIISRYQKKLLRYANSLVNNPDQAADIIQETFIKAFVNINNFNTKKKFSSWIYRIAHNQAINTVKKYHRETPLDPELDFDSGINLEDSYIKKELQKKANQCLEKLDIKYKEPLTLYYLQNKSYEEISDILRLPIGTIGTRINRAKNYMKKICQTKK